MDDRVAKLGPDEVPGPGTMCFHWKADRTVCTLKPEHDGDHMYIYINITINEDTKDFSPIPLNRIRNEFRDTLKEELTKHNLNVLMIETIPINDREGILLIALRKGDEL